MTVYPHLKFCVGGGAIRIFYQVISLSVELFIEWLQASPLFSDEFTCLIHGFAPALLSMALK